MFLFSLFVVVPFISSTVFDKVFARPVSLVPIVRQLSTIVHHFHASRRSIFFRFFWNYNHASFIFLHRNNGVCLQPALGSYTCTCPCGFTGRNCETRIFFCAQNTTYCTNGGTCLESSPCSVQCLCPSGYYGINCEIIRDVSLIVTNFKNGYSLEIQYTLKRSTLFKLFLTPTFSHVNQVRVAWTVCASELETAHSTTHAIAFPDTVDRFASL